MFASRLEQNATMADSRNIDVFISFARRDEAWASQFVDELEAQGVHAWLDKTDIAPRDHIGEKLEQALRESRVVAVLISPNYITNPSSAFELGAALGGNKKIIPILTQEGEDLPRLPSLLRDRQMLTETSP
jgi:TIR domain